MRFMITASKGPEAKSAPEAPITDELFAAYMKFNEDLAKAGVLLASEGLNPDGKGARVGVSRGKRVVLDGPFAESKELVGGFYLIEVGTRQEAIDWALRCPTGLGTDDVLTIHQMTSAEDIPPKYRELIEKVAPTFSAMFTRKKL